MGNKENLITANCPRCGIDHSQIDIYNHGPFSTIRCPHCYYTITEQDGKGINALIEEWNALTRIEGILSEDELISISQKKAVELFGKEFVDKHVDEGCTAWFYDSDCFSFFAGYDVKEATYPHKGPKYKGWNFWVLLHTDLFTGKTNIEHCCLPDGRRITK